MTMSTSKRTVTFARPFRLDMAGAEFPAGRYFIEIDDRLPDELSFPFYRQTATMMQLIADPLGTGVTAMTVIDLLQLEAALEADAAPTPEAEPTTSRPPTDSHPIDRS